MVMPHSSTQVQCGVRNCKIELLAIDSPCLQFHQHMAYTPNWEKMNTWSAQSVPPLFCLLTSYTTMIDERWLKIFATLVIERYGIYSFTLNLDGLCDCLANRTRQAQASQTGSFHSLSLRMQALEVACSH